MQSSTRKIAAALLASSASLLAFEAALAQSTATQEVEEVVVTAQRQMAISGVIAAEQVSKSRATVTQEYLATQPAGESVIQSLNLVPGVSFTNSDAYGSSGGNLRLRSFDGNRVSLTVDGIPLNDTGNYAIYTNQQLDPEIITRAAVNQGTTDVDSPTASATGGTINIATRMPSETPGLNMAASLGDFDYRRISVMGDTGAFGPWGTTAWLQGSYQVYDKFRGPGELQKNQVNGRIYQDLGNDSFASLIFHYNENRNNFYRNLTKAQIAYYGDEYDNLSQCARDLGTTGVADNDNASPFGVNGPNGKVFLSASDNPLNTSSCTSYYQLRINPSNTGNIRGQFSWKLGDSLRFTFDPSFQYVLANGGGTTVQGESSALVAGSAVAYPTCQAGQTGRDLNFDGDCLDSVRFYTPNNTNTRRWGFTSSLIWDINESHRLRAAYTWDYGRHRQTGEWTFLDAGGDPDSIWGGKDGYDGDRVLNADGFYLRQLDRFSIAELNQIAVDYNGHFWNDTVRLSVGVRAPVFDRELNQHCYTQPNGFAYCSSQTPSVPDADGYVTLAGSGATRYLLPFKEEKQYDKILPNIGVSVLPFGPEHVFYASYAEGFSAPRTDNLYAYGDPLVDHGVPDVRPETTKSYDLGYRFQGPDLLINAALWKTDYRNRIVSAFDVDTGTFVDRNIGDVEIWGVDAQAGWQANERLSLYASASYNHSEVQDDLVARTSVPFGIETFLPTSGKRLVDTPDWTVGGRIQYSIWGLTLGFQGKYVGRRYSTDVNDEEAEAFTVFDADAFYDLSEIGLENTSLQFNVINVFDEDYLGVIGSTTNNAKPVITAEGTVNPSAPTYAIGAPRTVQATLRVVF